MTPYIAEFVGTMILILLGDGVVANVNLNKSGMKGAGAVQITLAWGLAVLVPAFIFGAASRLLLTAVLHGAWYRDILWHSWLVLSAAHALYICCSKISLTQQKTRQRSAACSVRHLQCATSRAIS